MISLRPLLLTLFAAMASAMTSPVAAQQKANQLFGAMRTASPHAPQSIGFYSKGCAAGLQELPESGPTWQAMRLSRNRNWGHPETIAFIQRISRTAAAQPGWSGLYIGDISQPRGGPMTSGHQSHQIGLDIDIWMRPAQNLRLSRGQRENLSSISVRSADQRRVNGNWTPQHAAIIEAAARDDAVDRIFVTAPVKIAMCNAGRTRADREWLQKIRPFWGHHYHFHVRLKCPRGDRGCQDQTPSVRELSNGGDGCDDTLLWWVTDALDPPKSSTPAQPAPKRRSARDYTMSDLPPACRTVLAAR